MPAPSVAAENFCSNSIVREFAMWSSSNPMLPQGFPFSRAGRRIHIEAPVLSQLHRSHANTACGGVH